MPEEPTATRPAPWSCEERFAAAKKEIAQRNERVQRAARKDREAEEKEDLARRRRRDLW